MGLEAGSTILHYRLVEAIGEGGMGAVWRATDTKLGRDVALKVLPEAVAGDAERRARFQREAKVLASLNHPNVATLFDLEESDGQRLLVMELVEGEDLAARIDRTGPISLDRALPIAMQIAEGLEAAHERGIVHRDLKPANVMLGPDGTVKVLDFGLATALEPGTSIAADLSFSPTLTAQMTQAGVILGTAAYMSPEQTRGEAVDRRADIWAFGVVLWEMLTGRRLFQASSATEVLASVLRDEIDFEDMPDGTPDRVKRLLERCLDRDPRQRLQAIGEARIVLASDEEAPAEATPPPKEPASRWARSGWLVAAVAGIAAIAAWVTRGPVPTAPTTVEAALLPPASATYVFDATQAGSLSVSPDGRWFTFSAALDGGEPQLWIRPADDTAARTLPGSQGASFPFWSPDSREVAFFADRKLQRIALEGSAPTVICPASDGRGGSWNRDGVIVFSSSPSSGILRVPAAGGEPVEVTELDLASGESTHRWPHFLPDGRRFIYFSGGHGVWTTSEVNALWVADLETGDRTRLKTAVSKGVVAAGHLVYAENGGLVAQRLDLDSLRLTGPSTIVVPEVGGSVAYAISDFDVSGQGVMVYRTGGAENVLQLHWADMDPPAIREPLGEPVGVEELQFSPDGTLLAMLVADPDTGSIDVWIHDLERDLRWRLTFDAQPMLGGLTWAPDGQQLAYGLTTSDGTSQIRLATIDNPGRSTVVLDGLESFPFPSDWTPDGAALLYISNGGVRRLDLETGESVEVIPSDAEVYLADLSEDGRWLLYLSGQLGDLLAFVTEMPDASRRWQVHDQPSIAASWNGDRGMWMVASGGRFHRASFEVVDGSPVIGRPEPQGSLPSTRNGSIHPNEDRAIVAVTTVEETGETAIPVRVVTGWTARLESP
jgi:serine/threonine protein kinase/Tol biopolymer transport system component